MRCDRRKLCFTRRHLFARLAGYHLKKEVGWSTSCPLVLRDRVAAAGEADEGIQLELKNVIRISVYTLLSRSFSAVELFSFSM
jgi:hypothetical protein